MKENIPKDDRAHVSEVVSSRREMGYHRVAEWESVYLGKRVCDVCGCVSIERVSVCAVISAANVITFVCWFYI